MLIPIMLNTNTANNPNKKIIFYDQFLNGLILAYLLMENINTKKNNCMNNSRSYNRQENNPLEKPASVSKDQKDLYESVFHKQYQIIQSFLEKINSLYSKNEQFENTLNTLQQKLTKIQGNNANIHYQFRTTHFMMDKRLNTIMDDYNNINQQIQLLRTDIPISSQHMHTSSLVKKRQGRKKNKNIQMRQKSSNGSILPAIVVNHIEKQLSDNLRLSNVESSLEVGERRRLINIEEEVHKRISQTCKAILPSCKSQESSDSSSESFQQQLSQQQIQPKKNDRESIGIVYSMQWVENQIQRRMEHITKKIDTSLLEWKEERNRIREQIFGQQAQRFFSKIQAKIQQKMNNLYLKCLQQHHNIRKEIQNVNETSLKNIGALQYKLTQKVQNQYFQDSMNNLSTAFSIELSNKQKYYSNKHETQRAIKFLQNKINKIIQEEDNANNTTIRSPKEGKAGQQICLRINRCTSRKKSEVSASEKNINSKVIENCNTAINSLNFSAIEQQKIEQYSNCQQNNYKSNISSIQFKKINWKRSQGDKINTFKVHSQAKIRKTSITKGDHFKNRSSYSNFAPVEKVTEKEWKEKVVKVLNSGDRKRVKVTFH